MRGRCRRALPRSVVGCVRRHAAGCAAGHRPTRPAGSRWCLRRAVAALGLDGTAVEVVRRRGVGRRLHPGAGATTAAAAPLRIWQDMEQHHRGRVAVGRVRERAWRPSGGWPRWRPRSMDARSKRSTSTRWEPWTLWWTWWGRSRWWRLSASSRVAVGPIPVGGGTVEIAHGRMGVPAPATARLLEGYPIVGGPETRELTTPTGALLVGQLRSRARRAARDGDREGGATAPAA